MGCSRWACAQANKILVRLKRGVVYALLATYLICWQCLPCRRCCPRKRHAQAAAEQTTYAADILVLGRAKAGKTRMIQTLQLVALKKRGSLEGLLRESGSPQLGGSNLQPHVGHAGFRMPVVRSCPGSDSSSLQSQPLPAPPRVEGTDARTPNTPSISPVGTVGLTGPPMSSYQPTTGFNIANVDAQGFSWSLKEVGGSPQLQQYWKHYCRGSQGLLFVAAASSLSHGDDIGNRSSSIDLDVDAFSTFLRDSVPPSWPVVVVIDAWQTIDCPFPPSSAVELGQPFRRLGEWQPGRMKIVVVHKPQDYLVALQRLGAMLLGKEDDV